VIILDHAQHSPEWYAARRGIPTASCFASIITPAKAQLSTGASGYIDELIDEIVRPEAPRGFGGNEHTERGNNLEPAARAWYSLQNDSDVRQVGLVLADDSSAGCSPDSLVEAFGDPEGGLEIKCPDGPTHVGYLRAGKLPDKYKPQVHGSLVITGLPWWDFLSYCPGYKPLLVRVYPDDYTAKVKEALAQFLAEYAKAREIVIGSVAEAA
jgi:hypothetical protein